jgi:hypothetical protein
MEYCVVGETEPDWVPITVPGKYNALGDDEPPPTLQAPGLLKTRAGTKNVLNANLVRFKEFPPKIKQHECERLSSRPSAEAFTLWGLFKDNCSPPELKQGPVLLNT